MADESSYRVFPGPKLKPQIVNIFLQLKALGQGGAFKETLRRIQTSLKSDPLSFGDPQFSLKLPGATVYHRLIEGVSIHYAVYPNDRVVFVHDMKYTGRKVN